MSSKKQSTKNSLNASKNLNADVQNQLKEFYSVAKEKLLTLKKEVENSEKEYETQKEIKENKEVKEDKEIKGGEEVKDNKVNIDNNNLDFKYEILPEDQTNFDLSFKIIVIGDSGVGKSCLTSLFSFISSFSLSSFISLFSKSSLISPFSSSIPGRVNSGGLSFESDIVFY